MSELGQLGQLNVTWERGEWSEDVPGQFIMELALQDFRKPVEEMYRRLEAN